MIYWVGKVLEAVALVTVAAALALGLATGNIRAELTLLGASAGLFIIGRMLERKGAAR